MREALLGQGVEKRTSQAGVLQGSLDGLPLRPQHRIGGRRQGNPRTVRRRLRAVRGSDGVVVVPSTSTWGTIPFRTCSPTGTTGAARTTGTPAPNARARRRTAAPLLARLLADATHHQRRIVPAHPAGELAGVLVPQRRIADVGDHRHGAAEGVDAALGVVQIVLGEHRTDRELEHRHPRRHQVTHRGVPTLLAEVARILAGRGHRDERLAGELLVPRERPQGGLLAGLVTVEGVDDLAAEIIVIEHQAPQRRQVVLAERGATRGHGGRDPGRVHGHDICIALDHHRATLGGDVPLGQIQTEQHLGLLVEHRLGRVHVLAQLVVLEQLSCAEADNLAGQVADGPQQAAMEPVDEGAAGAGLGQARRLEFLGLEALAHEVLAHGVPAGGRVAAPEMRGLGHVEAALGEEIAGGLRLRVLLQPLGVELLGRRVGLREPRPGPAVTLDDLAAALVRDAVADPVRQLLDGLDEPDVLHLHEEGEDIPALARGEAVEIAVLRAHVERRGLLVLERRQTLERIRAAGFERDVLADDLLDTGALADRGDVLLRNPPCHVAQSSGPRRTSPPRRGRADTLGA